MTNSVQIHLVQQSFLVGDIRANARKIITLSHAARDNGADESKRGAIVDADPRQCTD